MRYLGGKARIGKKIAEQILTCVPPEHRIEYLEPFLGGANAFEHIAPHFEKTYAGDVHEDLILMWQAVARGWVPPEHVSEEEYQALKKAAPSALRGFAGFGCTFGGKWFAGYARGGHGADAATGRRSLLRQAQAFVRLVTLARVSFFEWPVVPGVVLYCDPPYAGTTEYKGASAFDHAAFWRRAREWSDAGSYVFVSEYSGPVDVDVCWSVAKNRGLDNAGYKAQEKLFYLPPRLLARTA